MKSRRSMFVIAAPAAAILAWLLVSKTCFGPQSRSGQAELLMAEADASLKEGKTAEAVERLRLGCKLAPRYVPVHRKYQNLMRKLERSDEVLAEYAKRVADDPKDAAAHYLHGRLLQGPEMESAFRRAIELQETLWWAHAGLGHYLFDKGDYVNCVMPLGTAYGGLQEKSLLYRVGMAYMRQGNMEAAVMQWEDFKRDFPSDPEGWFWQGAAYLDIGQNKLAFDMLSLAMKLDAKNSAIHAKYIESLLALDRFEEADEALKKARGLDAKPDVTVRFLIDSEHVGYLLLKPETADEEIQVVGHDRERKAVLKDNQLVLDKVVTKYDARPGLKTLLQDLKKALHP